MFTYMFIIYMYLLKGGYLYLKLTILEWATCVTLENNKYKHVDRCKYIHIYIYM